MAKKEPCAAEALLIFKDIMKRSLLEDFIFMNHIMVSYNTKEKYAVVLSIDEDLWKCIIDDEELKSHIKEFNPIEDSVNIKNIFSYENEILNDNWIDLDSDLLYDGKVMKININGIEYDIPICKSLIPLKLKKIEFNNIKYKIVSNKETLMILNKRFDYPIEKLGFSISRIFYIL
jgi:hypothetical protein